jgi:hypothetical protein
MMLKIGYFAEQSAPDAKRAVLLLASGQLVTYSDALLKAHQAARDLEAHWFTIDWLGVHTMA